jgi:DNA-binding MarR family transcriptional regulator
MDATVNLLHEFIENLIHYSMRDMFRYAKDTGLSMPQLGALMQVYHKQNCAVSDVGSEMGITSAAASQMLDRLVQQSYIERTEDPVDRRVKQIVLTEKGMGIVKGVIQARLERFSEIVSSLTQEEKQQTQKVITMLMDQLKSLK